LLTPDFSRRAPNEDVWYDLEHDRVLIEQSIAKQYGVLPSDQDSLSFADWSKLVGGLMEDTPLGRVVSIRSESDPDVIRRFTPDQKRIRSEWARHRNTAKARDQMALQRALATLCGKEVSGA